MSQINQFRGATKMIGLVLALTCSACAGPRVTALDVAIAAYQAEAQRACYAAQQMPAYADARDAALVAMARALTGDPCRATNVYDARQAIASEQNRAASGIVGSVATAGIATAGIIAGADVLKTAVRGAGVHGDGNVTASGQASANHDQSSRTITTTTTRPLERNLIGADSPQIKRHGPGRPPEARP